MKLYLMTQNVNNDYDTYDSCVVCAENSEDAKTIAPSGNKFIENENWSPWATTYADIEIEEIGEANSNQQRGVICASFNAG